MLVVGERNFFRFEAFFGCPFCTIPGDGMGSCQIEKYVIISPYRERRVRIPHGIPSKGGVCVNSQDRGNVQKSEGISRRIFPRVSVTMYWVAFNLQGNPPDL